MKRSLIMANCSVSKEGIFKVNGKIGVRLRKVKKSSPKWLYREIEKARCSMEEVGENANLEQKRYLEKHKAFNDLDRKIQFRSWFESKQPLYTHEELAQLEFKKQQHELSIKRFEQKKQRRGQTDFASVSKEAEEKGIKSWNCKLARYCDIAKKTSKLGVKEKEKIHQRLRNKIGDVGSSNPFERRLSLEKNRNFQELDKVISFTEVIKRDPKRKLYSSEEQILRDKELSNFVGNKKKYEWLTILSTSDISTRRKQIKRCLSIDLNALQQKLKYKAGESWFKRQEIRDEAIKQFEEYGRCLTQEDKRFLQGLDKFEMFQNLLNYQFN